MLKYCLYNFECIFNNQCNHKKSNLICCSDGVIYEDKILSTDLKTILKFLFMSKEDKIYYIIHTYNQNISKEFVKNNFDCFSELCWWVVEIKCLNLIVFLSKRGINIIKNKIIKYPLH